MTTDRFIHVVMESGEPIAAYFDHDQAMADMIKRAKEKGCLVQGSIVNLLRVPIKDAP